MAQEIRVDSGGPDAPVYFYPHGLPRASLRGDLYPRNNAGRGLLIILLIIVLLIGWRYYPFRTSSVDLTPTVETIPPATAPWFPPSTINPVTTATTARVDADELFLREGPGEQYLATYALPRDWPLALLGESRVDSEGEIWQRVRLNTDQGIQEGWVSQRYIR